MCRRSSRNFFKRITCSDASDLCIFNRWFVIAGFRCDMVIERCVLTEVYFVTLLTYQRGQASMEFWAILWCYQLTNKPYGREACIHALL